MKLVDVVNQFRLLLPKYTNYFSDSLAISNLIASGGVLTVVTSSAHGLSTSKAITLSSVKTQTPITGVSKDGLIFTFESDEHDLTLNWPEHNTVDLTGFDSMLWTSRVNATNTSWLGITYANNLFVAVSESGVNNRVMTSPDGITWTTRVTPADYIWYSVVYGNGLFVAVASDGVGDRVMTSPNGITWTLRVSAADNDWKAVTFGNGIFVAVASSGIGNRVMTSIDGINWTIRVSAADNEWRAITYGNSLFVATARTGIDNRVMTSPDGITWTSRIVPNDQWYGVTYGNNLFVACALGGLSNRIMTSIDGITWTSRGPVDSNYWRAITYANGYFVCVGSTGVNARVMTSPDGIIWTIRITPVDNVWRGIAYGNGAFTAIASDGTNNRVMTSSGVDFSWNGTFTLNDVPNRENFKIQSTNELPVLNGNEKLYEDRISGPNGQYSITKVNSTTFTIAGNFVDGTYIGGTVSKNVRVAGSIDLERTIEQYTKQEIPDLWGFVLMHDVEVSKDRQALSDATSTPSQGTILRSRFIDGFSLIVIVNTKQDISAQQAVDLCRHDLLLPILKSSRGTIFSTGLSGNGDFRTIMTGHGLAEYNKAIYAHMYTFEISADLTEEDAVEVSDTRAFRDIDYTQSVSNTEDMTVNIDLDDEPL